MSVNLPLGRGIGTGAGKAASAGCGSIVGIFVGLLLVPLGFYLVYHGEVKLVNHGKVFERVEMTSVEAAAQATGLVKIKGQPVGSFLALDRWDGQALFYRITVEEYEEETDAEGEVDYEWNTVSSACESKWADFSIGSIKVMPDSANPAGEEKVYEAYKPHFASDFSVDAMGRSPEVGDRRLTLEVLDASKEVIVLGEMGTGAVSGGSTFVVSALGDTATADALKTEYKIAYWVMKAAAVTCISLGLVAIFGPLLTIVGYIPLIGDKISCAFVFAAFVFAVVSVGIVTVFIKMFWLLVILVLLAIGLLIWRGFATPRQRPGSQPPAGQPVPSAVPRPVAAEPRPAEELKCPKCGADISRSDNFCTSCGAKLEEGRLVE